MRKVFLLLIFVIFAVAKDLFVVLDTPYSLKTNNYTNSNLYWLVGSNLNTNYFAIADDSNRVNIFSLKNFKKVQTFKFSASSGDDTDWFNIYKKYLIRVHSSKSNVIISFYNIFNKKLIKRKVYNIKKLYKDVSFCRNSKLEFLTDKFLILRININGGSRVAYIVLSGKNFKTLKILKPKPHVNWDSFDGKKYIYINQRKNEVSRINIFKNELYLLPLEIKTFTVLNNKVYGGDDYSFFEYDLKNDEKKVIINDSQNSLGIFSFGDCDNKADDYERFISVYNHVCPNDNYCYRKRMLIFDTKNEMFVKGWFLAGYDGDIRFYNKNKFTKIILTNKETAKNSGVNLIEKHYLVAPSMLSHKENEKLKKYYIYTIENKIGKKFSSNAKVVIFDSSLYFSQYDGATHHIYSSFAVIDNGKIYIYTIFSYKNKYKSNFYFYFTDNYKIILNGREYFYTKIYYPKTINRYNQDLAKSIVFEFPKIKLKIGDVIQFIEKDGNSGDLLLKLRVKDIF